MPPKTKVQFNVRIGKEYKRRVKQDAARTDGLKIDFIAEAIIAKFFRDFPVATERAKIYGEHSR
jgi:hypothetical protein